MRPARAAAAASNPLVPAGDCGGWPWVRGLPAPRTKLSHCGPAPAEAICICGSQPPSADIGEVRKSKIEFDRDGLILAGNLLTPEGFEQTGSYEAVIVAGSFSSDKELMAGTYAQKFAEQGLVALAFDYAHHGESAGRIRQLESPAEKLLDLQAAVTYLVGLPYVQAVGMVGV